MNKKIVVLQGGLSSEKEVSLNTAKSFAKALDELGYHYEVINADKNLPKALMDSGAEIVLNALHGKFAEDGTVQGICEYLQIPYSGSGVLASALTMDKVKTKQVLQQEKVVTPEFQLLNYKEKEYQTKDIQIALPFIVKPSREGSSVGISICRQESDIQPAINLARQHDYLVLVEKYIKGSEITVPILDGKALTPIEIIPNEHFYDYEHKYTKGKTNYLLPPNKTESVIIEIKKIAEKAYRSLNLRSYARIDFMVDEQDQIYFIEANPLPGCTETSLLPKSASYDGIAFKEVIEHLITSAALDYEGVR